MNTLDIINMLADQYKETDKMTDMRLRVYLDTLDDIPPSLLYKAALHIIKTGPPFMPKVSELRKAAIVISTSGKWSEDDEYTLDMLPDDSLLKQMVMDGRLQGVNLAACMAPGPREYWHIMGLFNANAQLDDRMLRVLGIDPHAAPVVLPVEVMDEVPF